MNRNEIFNQITDKIVAKLKEGVLPWRKSWKTGIPMNYISKRPYNGINFISLLMNDYASPYYLTFLQCQQRQGKILSGQKGSLVVYWSLKDMSKNPEDKLLVSLIRYSYVFNLAQTNLYNADEPGCKKVECEELISSLILKPIIRNNISRSYYSPGEDYISLPCIEDFSNPDEYYSTLFHELIHWTGHQSRLDRKDDYVFEELIAEIGSSYLSALCSLSQASFQNQVSYIDGWLKKLGSEPQYLIQAAQKAQKAVGFLNISKLCEFQPVSL
jgi:antirestriction protein ArdC